MNAGYIIGGVHRKGKGLIYIVLVKLLACFVGEILEYHPTEQSAEQFRVRSETVK